MGGACFGSCPTCTERATVVSCRSVLNDQKIPPINIFPSSRHTLGKYLLGVSELLDAKEIETLEKKCLVCVSKRRTRNSWPVDLHLPQLPDPFLTRPLAGLTLPLTCPDPTLKAAPPPSFRGQLRSSHYSKQYFFSAKTLTYWNV